MTAWSEDPAAVRPMLAMTADAPLDAQTLAYEPKYDGIRAIAAVPDGGQRVRLWSRLGNEKTTQFPEIVEALQGAARAFGRVVLLDGEIVALDARGDPVGFQGLQGRIHLKSAAALHAPDADRVAFIVFDLLRDGDEDVRSLPLHERRARLERLIANVKDPRVRISEQVAGDGRGLFERAQRHGWEGLIAKGLGSTYKSGRRSPDWRKLKLVRRQACVVGGWTEPRGSRPFFGALLLGLYEDDGRLQYVGHTGAGFSDAELGRVWQRLQSIKTKTSPFGAPPRTNERPHWVKPVLVAEVKFTEWTADRKLRHPTYMGLREDVKAESVRKEPDDVAKGAPRRDMARAPRRGRAVVPSGSNRTSETRRGSGRAALVTSVRGRHGTGGDVTAVASSAKAVNLPTNAALTRVLGQLDAIQDRGGDGVLELPGGRLEVSNLGKVFWPRLKLTKGDLFRHYVRVARVILPALADRPLVMKRYPNGVSAKPFYQHRAPDTPPKGVRAETVSTDTERRAHIVGGDLLTLLYTVQLASISQDPWFSRAGSERMVDHVAIDLDPPDGLAFARVLDVARWVREELEMLKAPGFAKTSGSSGLHIYVPMPPGTPYEAGLLFCQIVATMVASKHPKAATVERSVAARGSRIYVDYLQNIQGKTLASVYSPRANDFAGVSTPLTWDEIDEGVSPKDFTIANFETRLSDAGDLWAGLRKSKGADLTAVAQLVGTRGAAPRTSSGAAKRKSKP